MHGIQDPFFVKLKWLIQIMHLVSRNFATESSAVYTAINQFVTTAKQLHLNPLSENVLNCIEHLLAFIWKTFISSCPRPATLLKMRLWHRCFSVNFAKFLRTPFLQNASRGCFCTLLLQMLGGFMKPNKRNFPHENIK